MQRSSICRVACVLLLGGLLLPAMAATDSRQELDEALGSLKARAIAGKADMVRQQDALLYPPYARTTFYVDQRLGGFLLERLHIRVDGREIYSQEYSRREARALADGGIQQAARLSLPPGDYNLEVRFAGVVMQRRGDPQPISGASEGNFVKRDHPLDIVIPLRTAPRRGEQPAAVQKHIVPSASASASTPSNGGSLPVTATVAGSADDPRLGHVRYLQNVGRQFDALVVLHSLQDGTGDDLMPEPYYWLLADSYFAYGMHRRADRTLRILERMTDDQERLVSRQLDLAEFEYERGYLFDAIERLRAVRNQAERRHLLRWQDITSRVLLAQGRYREAADVLQERTDRSRHTPYMRYNLGVALVNAGQLQQGRAVLDEVARYPARDDFETALRDRANLTLGYHFLRNQLGGTAKPMFARVRVEGPFSNRALLGMGWAELAPQGERQTRGALDDTLAEDERFGNVANLGVLVRPGFFEADIYRRLSNRPFRRAGVDEDEEEALKRAIAYWLELTKRDPMDAAVQEGMLAIPYALDRLGAYEQSLEHYLRAIEVFEEALRRIDAGIQSVEGALMLHTIVRRDADAQAGYQWRLLDLPDLPETYWLNELLAEHRFQEQLKNYRDARQLASALESFNEDGVEAMAQLHHVPSPPESMRYERRASLADDLDLPALRLRSARSLGSNAAGRDRTAAVPAVQLREASVPARFHGPREEFLGSLGNFTAMRADLDQIAEAQSRAVRTIAIEELREQREQLENYLLEARFAVARQYDRQMRERGGAR